LRGFINVLGMNVSSIGEQPVFLRAVPIWTLGHAERSVRAKLNAPEVAAFLAEYGGVRHFTRQPMAMT